MLNVASGSTTRTWRVYLVIRQDTKPQIIPKAIPPKDTEKNAPESGKYRPNESYYGLVNNLPSSFILGEPGEVSRRCFSLQNRILPISFYPWEWSLRNKNEWAKLCHWNFGNQISTYGEEILLYRNNLHSLELLESVVKNDSDGVIKQRFSKHKEK